MKLPIHQGYDTHSTQNCHPAQHTSPLLLLQNTLNAHLKFLNFSPKFWPVIHINYKIIRYHTKRWPYGAKLPCTLDRIVLVRKCGNEYSVGRQTGKMKRWGENRARSWSKFPGRNTSPTSGIKIQQHWWNPLPSYIYTAAGPQTDRHTFNWGLSPKRQPRYHPPLHKPSASPLWEHWATHISHARDEGPGLRAASTLKSRFQECRTTRWQSHLSI